MLTLFSVGIAILGVLGGVYLFLPDEMGAAILITATLCLVALLAWLIAKNCDYKKDVSKAREDAEKNALSADRWAEKYKKEMRKNAMISSFNVLLCEAIDNALLGSRTERFADLQRIKNDLHMQANIRIKEIEEDIHGKDL